MKFDSTTFLRERHFCGPSKWRASNAWTIPFWKI